jgi:RNA polymerase primary sigma factor
MHYQNQGVLLEDLVAVGNRGLLRAAEKFDLSQNIKFISYAVWWIRQEILLELSLYSRIIRIPLNKAVKISRMYRARCNQGSTPEKIAEELEIGQRELDELSMMTTAPIYLDAPVKDSADITNAAMIPDPEWEEESIYTGIKNKEMADELLNYLNNDREKEIMKKSFGMCPEGVQSLSEIAKQMNLSRERVRQIKEVAIIKIREVLNITPATCCGIVRP